MSSQTLQTIVRNDRRPPDVTESLELHVRRCAHCGRELARGGRYGAKYCKGGACRQAAYRRRRAGVPEDTLAGRGYPLAGGVQQTAQRLRRMGESRV